MQLEVIVQGKGSITLSQKCDFTPKQIRRLAEHSVQLINGSRRHEQYGFAAGTTIETEIPSEEEEDE